MSILDKVEPAQPVKIKLASLPGVDVFVRELTGAEFIELGDRLTKAGDDRKTQRGIELETLLIDAEGKPLLAVGEGVKAVDRMKTRDLQAIDRVSNKLNLVSDAALEDAAKN